MAIGMSLLTNASGKILGSGKKDAKAGYQGFNWLSSNPNFQQAQSSGLQAGNAVNALLGLGGDPTAQMQAFDRFRDSSGYQFRLGEGLKAITGNNAAAGLLNSGSALKGITNYGQNMASGEFANYLMQLLGQQQQGLGAAGTVGNALMQAGMNESQVRNAQRLGLYSGATNMGVATLGMVGNIFGGGMGGG